MNRSGFKPRRKSLRDYCQAKAKRANLATPRPKPPKHVLKRQSDARAREMRLYYAERAEWLLLPQNAPCAICLCLGQPPMAATEVHHQRGRIGRLLRYQPFWVASCRACRLIPHERPAWAREMGILCEAKDWNVYPRD